MSKQFNIEVYSVETNERFPVKRVSSSTKIHELKIRLELIAGIPTHLQRIMYLDQGDMEDNSTLRHHDVVTGASLTLNIWKSWSSLIRACARGHIADVMDLGVTIDSSFRNPNIEHMDPEARKKCFLSRAAIALYVAVHRGHLSLIKELLKTGVDIGATTKNGRNILHVAAANGQDKCIELLLANGAGHLINATDDLGETPLQTACLWGQKACEGRLFLFQWRKRAGTMKSMTLLTQDQLMAHQLFDSSSKTWLYGDQSQMYQSQILPPQEFQGSGIGSKRSDHRLDKIKVENGPTKTKSLPVARTFAGPRKLVIKTPISDSALLTRGKIKEGFEEFHPLNNAKDVSRLSLRETLSQQLYDETIKEKRIKQLNKIKAQDDGYSVKQYV
uniref:Ankyrin repeat domain-containing protein 60 n=1 Tax=Phallusia mammillata TaxID=59560 RepID=A0A6F9D5Q8_9ASCI|nr:ankyrin repeat domain-containing protein 60 [Phallusia mammillata]